MDFSTIKEWDIPDGIVTKVESGASVIWQKAAGIINWAKKSINADGSIYNNGLGHKIGYRVRSGGAELALESALCTGFIPFLKGQILEISPAFTGKNTENTVNFIDGSFTNLGQATDSGSLYGICTKAYRCTVVDGRSVLTFTDEIDSRVAYVRVSHATYTTSNGENLVITVT